MQTTLFGNQENMKKDKSLKIVPKEQQPLTKNQQLFNKLTKRIENLEIAIIKENEKLGLILNSYSQQLQPILRENATMRIKLAMSIADSTKHNKYEKKHLKNITEVILELCIAAFEVIEPDAVQEAFYDQWSPTKFKDEVEQQKTEEKDMFSNIVNNIFGMDIDMDDFDDTPEGMARLQAKMKNDLKDPWQYFNTHDGKKTKKQLEAEKQEQAEEAIKNKSIRSIYLTLVKILHPDTEMDPVLKKEKEEIMKKVTSAYDKKDLSVLLKLEMEWVHKENEHLEQLTDDKLKIYISALKQQVAELEQQKFSIYMNPRFAPISEYIRYPEKTAMNKLKSQITSQKVAQKILVTSIKDLEKPDSKKRVLDFVSQFLYAQIQNELVNIVDNMFEDGKFTL